MFIVLNVVIIGSIFVIIDLVPLYQNEEWVSFFLFSSLLLIALVLAVLMGLKIEIPRPPDYIEKIVTFILGLEEQ